MDDYEHGDVYDDELRGMARSSDWSTCYDAAAAIHPIRTKLHKEVLEVFAGVEDMTDGELEELPQFTHYGYSTLRKRRTELYQAGLLEAVTDDQGKAITRRNLRGRSMIVWRIVKFKQPASDPTRFLPPLEGRSIDKPKQQQTLFESGHQDYE